ncbi:heme-binding protein, partial [Streptomyces sp. UNOB3_S3]|uniref:GlcG/HbpS family heme-binding protein n=1 Tax=Streptomyces sp. UNOB3_S3 TaxID=2871682 RepID=UPI001E42395E
AGAPAPSAKGLVQVDRLSVDAATKAAQAALAAARKDGQKVSVAVVDRDGNTVVTLRGDGAGPQSYQSAERKAFTAVSWNAPTSELVKRLQQVPNLKDIPGTLFLPGGAPVQAKGAPVAGIGVAGAPSGDLDEKYAKAGVAGLAE